MITSIPNGGEFDDSFEHDNDFVGRNKNMQTFFKDHDTEKRQAFTKLKGYFSIRAKINKQALLADKREKAL